MSLISFNICASREFIRFLNSAHNKKVVTCHHQLQWKGCSV